MSSVIHPLLRPSVRCSSCLCVSGKHGRRLILIVRKVILCPKKGPMDLRFICYLRRGQPARPPSIMTNKDLSRGRVPFAEYLER